MEKWSILSDVVKYVQYNKYPIGHYESEVKAPEEIWDKDACKVTRQ